MQLWRKKCPVASTYKINIQTPFWHLQSTCWSFWHRLIRPNVRMTTSGSAANSTATMPVPYRQRLNGPNVKSTSGWTAVCSQFVVLLRGPGEQPGSARQDWSSANARMWCSLRVAFVSGARHPVCESNQSCGRNSTPTLEGQGTTEEEP